ncbi:dihydroxyacetone kinase subunit DhaK [Oceanobacillus oncorhynchi]|uniref:dihydroxyacetone kinase subunit DhaK n=1 Tax=Oceanobacillus TaxID=182709 RepID=UPI002116A8B5|nr:dihydroxyacetone kinase subunit DhaK [Oceanobacillus oncorhynchi]UUI40680.1 dihydroxyacetone kinase subunit DhaK [Oceanobacillus oncorhynchi]
MKKLINEVDDVVLESLEGFVTANHRTHQKVNGVNGVIRKVKNNKKVSIVLGGGSGHEPVFLGLVGEGMADGAALGSVFASPDPQTILEVIKSSYTDEGTLCLVINYAGDTMNFGMASELSGYEDLKVETALVTDDVASAPKGQEEERRGVAGLLLITKVTGAAAEKGCSLAELKNLAEKANRLTRTMGIALTPCSLPGSKPNFTIGEDEYEFGMGIHGEPGIKTKKLKTANEIVAEIVEGLVNDLNLQSGDEVVVLVNGTGATTILELNIVYRQVAKLLKKQDIHIYDTNIGSYCTSLEMAGVSISVMKLDNELKSLYNEPAYTPYFYRRGAE